jgi:hypothetical protein
MQATTPSPWDRPVFVASMGRSGSTLLQRLLNVHPQLTIWGEHGGFLKGISEAYRLIGVEPSHREQLEAGYAHRDTVIGGLDEHDKFRPWVSPFTSDTLVARLREFVVDTFTEELPQDIRWGFKEIRYSGAEMRGLMQLFPAAHLVILARDVPGYAKSRFFAFGYTDFDLQSEEGVEVATSKIDRMVDGWMKRYTGLLDLASEEPHRTSVVAYSDLVAGNDRISRLFTELGEEPPGDEALARVLDAKAGSSYRWNEAARENQARLDQVISNATYDRARCEVLAARLGLS